MNEPKSSQSPEQSGGIAFLLRTLWLMLGNVGLAVIAIVIIMNHPPLFSLYDLLFWAVVVMLIIVRYIDIAYFHGGDSYGDPATMRHWRKYAVLLPAISLVMWAIAHGLAYYFFKQ